MIDILGHVSDTCEKCGLLMGDAWQHANWHEKLRQELNALARRAADR